MHRLVAFHAHPDDEALLTAGTMARAVASGHRVALVYATDGGAGSSGTGFGLGGDLAERRRVEAVTAAATLGVDRVRFLGYDDSGMAGAPSGLGRPFASASVEEAAGRLAEVLREEDADVLTTYDPAGGYGHPDHVQVHRVGARAAELAGTPVLLEATIDRDLLRWALGVARWIPGRAGFDPGPVRSGYTARAELTHRVDVRRFAGQKRAAMAAHASQVAAGSDPRTLQLLLRLPGPVFDRVLGHEWYRQPGRTPTRPLLDDVFAGLG
jgi:LmbE family N-acetylglucosaminyl deacetylase